MGTDTYALPLGTVKIVSVATGEVTRPTGAGDDFVQCSVVDAFERRAARQPIPATLIRNAKSNRLSEKPGPSGPG
jgi:hypothetical protein